MDPTTSPKVLTVEQVARLLQVSRWFVYEHGEELGLVKLGGANRYLRERVENYLAEQGAPRSPPAKAIRRTQRQRRKRQRRVPLLDPGSRPDPEAETS
jgi:predicted DNA-binding transcriptional regulator AlpA